MSQLSLDIERIKTMYSTILQYAARTGIPVPQEMWHSVEEEEEKPFLKV